MKKRHSIALLIETSNHYSRELLRGIHDYVIERGLNWSLHLTEQGRGSNPPSWWNGWKGSGIIARIENSRIESAVKRKGLPVVSVSASGFGKEYPTVISDSFRVAQLAAQHLIERGFRYFGYCGDARFKWSSNHQSHFQSILSEVGYPCHIFRTLKGHAKDPIREKKDLITWLRDLPKPVGIMACFDNRGHQILDGCRQIGALVPEEVGVIGQHNDTLLCELCDPPLSSVIPNPRSSGYQSALLLDRLINKRKVKTMTYPIPPIGVGVRQSTDFISSKDPDLIKAMTYIRNNAFSGITVEDVIHHVPMSRTQFERKFREAFQRSPYDTILAIRFRLAEQLLLSSDLRIHEVAEKTCFATAEYFSAIFKKRYGISPRDFRDKKS